MLKKDKKLFITLILMFIIVASLIIVAWLYEDKNNEYENLIDAKTKSLNSMTLSYGELKKENEALYKKIEELEEENKNFVSGGDFATYQQTLIQLSDISLMIKTGDEEGAREELLKIETMGFDPTALSFYESLCRELNIKTN